MTKADIISEVFDKVGLPKQDAEEMVEMILDTIKQALKQGETVKLSGFGNFVVRKQKFPQRPQSQDGAGDRDHSEKSRQFQAQHDL